jgi:hypothetical protein
MRLSAIDIVQWVYSHAEHAHVEELLTCNEATVAVIVAAESGEVQFRNPAADEVFSLNRSEALTGSPLRLAASGTLYRAAEAALTNRRLFEANSVFWRLPASGGGEWLVVACGGEFDRETTAFILIGRAEARLPRAPTDVVAWVGCVASWSALTF